MQRLSGIMSRFNNLSVNTTSSHPTPNDSARIHPELFEEDAPAAQKAAVPLVTDVVVKHSSVFNSERTSGMGNLQQLQFVEMVKKTIVGECNSSSPWMG